MSNLNFFLKSGYKKLKCPIHKNNFLAELKPKKNHPPVKNFIKVFKYSLKNSKFGWPFAKVIQPNQSTAIVVSDKTRETLARKWLPVLLDELNKLGIPDKKIFVIFALGGHGQLTPSEQKKIIGRLAARRIAFFNHNCLDKKNLVKIGVTRRGTPVEINKKYFEAANKILTGVITYHYFAGFTGGRKSVLPGLASFEAIAKNHSILYNRKLNPGTLAAAGVLTGNPLSEDMLEAARMTRPTFLINFVIEGKKPLAIFTGDFQKAHELGCRFFNQLYRVPIKEKADLVVAGAGGYPKDLDFVQAHKAVDNAVKALKPGGVLIILAEAKKTFPSEKYLKAFGLEDPVQLEKQLLKKYCVPTQTCLAFLKKAQNFKIIWVSKYLKKYAKLMNLTAVSKMSEAFDKAREFLPENFKAYVMPEATLTLPGFKK